MTKPARSRRRKSAGGSLPIRVTSLRFNPADPIRLAQALLLNAAERAARAEGKPRAFLAGHDRLADIPPNNHLARNRKEETHDHQYDDDHIPDES